MGGKRKAKVVAPPAEGTGITVEQHLKDLGLLGGAETPTETPAAPQPETFEVDLFDTVPVVINGQHVQLQKGKQAVSKQIYNVLKDAKLI